MEGGGGGEWRGEWKEAKASQEFMCLYHISRVRRQLRTSNWQQLYATRTQRWDVWTRS